MKDTAFLAAVYLDYKQVCIAWHSICAAFFRAICIGIKLILHQTRKLQKKNDSRDGSGGLAQRETPSKLNI